MIDPPGDTKPFDTPGAGASTAVVSFTVALLPGVALAELVIEPPVGTVAGLVTTSVAWADPPTIKAPSEQSTGAVPEHELGAEAATRLVPAGSVSRTCASATGAMPLLVTMRVY